MVTVCLVFGCVAPQAHASAAVVNFSECAEQEILPPYLDTLISKLLVGVARCIISHTDQQAWADADRFSASFAGPSLRFVKADKQGDGYRDVSPNLKQQRQIS
jgi:hypothetical protein